MKRALIGILVVLAMAALILYLKVDDARYEQQAEAAYVESQKGPRCTGFDCQAFCRILQHIDFELWPEHDLDVERMLPAVCHAEW